MKAKNPSFLSRNVDRTSTNQHSKLSSDIFETTRQVRKEKFYLI
jgi:hypothetical protein